MGDAENKQPPGTKFSDLPENWYCPMCGASKGEFEKMYEGGK
jgi:rubredoxin